MTERCGEFYNGDYRCMLHRGHLGLCGPGNLNDRLLREAFEAGAKWVAQVDDPGRTKWSMDRGFADFRESLAVNQGAESGIASPAASPAQKEHSHNLDSLSQETRSVDQVITIRKKWAAYRWQRPRSFDGTMVDEVAIEREDKLMYAFIDDLDALIAALSPSQKQLRGET